MKIIFVLTFLFSNLCWASIPSFNFLTQRLAKTHGSGSYVIKKDLSFFVDNSVIHVEETWIVSSSQRMHLKVRSLPSSSEEVSFDYFYLKGVRSFYKEGQLQTKNVSQNFYWPLFLTNSSRIIKDILVKNKIVPSSALFNQPTPKDLKEINHEPVDFISLARVGGQISYKIGKKESGESGSSLWLTQDGFNISKLKLPSGARVTPKAYKRFARNMWLPQSQSILYGADSVQVAITSVVPTKRSKVNQKSLQQKSVLPKITQIKEFYETLR